MFGRRSRIVFIRLQCLCLSYTLPRLQCCVRSCFILLRSQLMSLKNYSVMQAPVLGVRIRIVTMQILQLASYYSLALRLQCLQLRIHTRVIYVYCSGFGSSYSVLAFVYAAPVREHRRSAGPDPRIFTIPTI
jgi:hypothetical protein